MNEVVDSFVCRVPISATWKERQYMKTTIGPPEPGPGGGQGGGRTKVLGGAEVGQRPALYHCLPPPQSNTVRPTFGQECTVMLCILYLHFFIFYYEMLESVFV